MSKETFKLTLGLIILILFYNAAQAQINERMYDLQNVIPPSPNSASIAKYTDWPVNLYTGLPGISIPIYEVKGRSTSVGLSLSYHASGIKVGEYASSVGLGWSLQAGGCITRSVRGLPDEESGAGYLSIRSGYHNPGDLSSGTTPASIDSIHQLDVAKDLADGEPDLFMISAMGKSYKFFFNGDGTVVTQPYSNLKITASFSDSSWTVVTEDGTKLRFGGGNKFVELTSSSNFDNGSAVSSWYLKSITSTTGETINFTYTVSNINHESYYFQSDYLFDHVVVNNLLTGAPVTNKVAATKSQLSSSFVLNLATIESDLCKVFVDTTSRLDLTGGKAISGIRVFSKLTNSMIKSYKFYYGYSTAVTGITYGTDAGIRLKLDSLEEIPSDNNPHKFWQFGYNSKNLPSRKSYAQDYWGYFNGKTSNTTMLPFCLAFNPDSYPYGIRSPDSASMMAEMLTKITYPTGGYSLFNYEPNSYPNNEEQFTKHSDFLHLYLTYNQTGFTNTQTTSFTITRQQYFNYHFTGIFSASYQANFGPATILASATLRKTDGTIMNSISLVKGNSGTPITKASILLQPGSYNFTISSISPQSDFQSTADNVDLSADYSYNLSGGFKVVNHPLGGVRVQSILYYDNVDTTKSIKKVYTYENPNVIAPVDSTVDFVSPVIDNYYDCDGTLTGCSPLAECIATSLYYNARNTATKFSLGSIQGSTVGYGKVTERLGLNGENGKNVYYYNYTGDVNVTAAKLFPFPAIISKDYERGLLLEEDNFTSGNILVSKTLNAYQYLQRRSINSYKIAYQFNILSTCYSFTALSGLLAKVYVPDNTDQVMHNSAKQIAYNTATGDSLVTTTNYFYDDTLNMQPVRIVTFNSKGDSVLVNSRTALEKTAINSSIPLSATASLALDSMKARNMVGIPVESEKYTKSVLTSKALTNYKLESNGSVQPDNVQLQNASNTLETRVYFPKYTLKGNLSEQLKSAGEKHDYIWDYQSTYPVAEVVNADSNSIAFTSFEADGTGNWNISSSARDSVTPAITGYKSYNLTSGPISTTITLTSSKTYIVSYWSKAASFTVTSGGTPKQGKTIVVNGTSWTYYEHTITGVTSITISGTNNIDELRLYPAGAQMTSFAYLPLVGVTSQSDLNNRITYYQYDGFQQLYLILDQDRNVLKKFCYDYSGQNIACSQFYSVQKSGTYFRTNCNPGYTAGSYTTVITANKYTSLVSQAAADALAQADLDVNGPANANLFGTCTAPSITISAANGTLAAGFTATFTNTTTLVQTVFHILSTGGNIGSVPAGTYNILLAQTGNTTVHYIYGVCGVLHGSAVSTTFSNVAISTSCHTITIDTVN